MEPAAVQVRDAATVVLLRDGDAGLEVFMLRRNLSSVFVAGAHVFPGGAVDPEDRAPEAFALALGRTDAEASAALGLDQGGLAFWNAVVRECFEEAGILLATAHDSGEVVSFADPDVEKRFVGHRDDLNAGRRTLAEVCTIEGLRLALGGIHAFSHWITPLGAPRRYDTRFFVAAAPTEQVPLHDDQEAIAHEWIRPADALAAHRDGQIELIEPTFMTLRALSRFGSADEAIAAVAGAASAGRARVVEAGSGVRIGLPGDPGPGRD